MMRRDPPVAVVHWLHKGKEYSEKCYTDRQLRKKIIILYGNQCTYWVCMCDPLSAIPFNNPERLIEAL
jgi:hypothetical protein